MLLLRRLAIHAITMHPELSPEQRLNWLLDHIDRDRVSGHHEVYRAVALNYPSAAELTRKAFVEAILAHSLPASDDLSAEERSARLHFDWLSWLHRAKPDCVPCARPYPSSKNNILNGGHRSIQTLPLDGICGMGRVGEPVVGRATPRS